MSRTIDLIIATSCIAGGHALLTSDRDFAPMAEHLGLRWSEAKVAYGLDPL